MSTTATKTTSRTIASPSSPRIPIYKGKDVRSWQQLPAEIVRHIATHYLVIAGEAAYTPNSWAGKDMWPSRLLYTVLRDANEVEKLMSVCRSWTQALEHHRFWQHACAVMDPHDMFAQHAIIKTPPTAGSIQAPSQRLPPYRHFRNLTNSSCWVCRINWPFMNNGLGSGKRIVFSPYFRAIYTCREHRKATYCSLCLHLAPLDDTQTMICCVENEDEETWPNAEATCRSCRSEALWRRAAACVLDREAFRGPPFKLKNIVDWEVRQAVDTFVEMGEGSISDVLTLAREKHWLRTNTKIAELLSQAVAASRYVTRAEADYDTGVDASEDELSGDDEDDPEFMSLTEDAGGIRELAISDWARNRILDGYWVSPADQYYEYVAPAQPATPAVHPCPWLGATYSGALVDGESAGDGEELDHPRPRTYRVPYPPTFQLCELAHRTYSRVLREILLPAMANIVRRLLMECSADGTDPAQRALKMSLEDVVRELRDHATWTRGTNWLELRAARLREERSRHTGSEEDDASSSSRSDGSHTTSPVLSTTTLQTTPSPPPCGKEDESVGSPMGAPAMAIPTSPSLHTKELLRPVPYVPVSISELPHYSYDCLRQIWREACAPLYNCRCSICERAMLKVNMDASRIVSEGQQPPVQIQRPVQIRIEDPSVIALREEEEEEYSDVDLDDGEPEKDDDVEELNFQPLRQDSDENPFYVPPNDNPAPEEEVQLPTWETKPDLKGVQDSLQRTRKRSHDETPDDIFMLLGVQKKTDGAVTPPKRQRKEGSCTPSPPPSKETLLPSPMRARKRSSEELEDEHVASDPQNGKRVKASHDIEVERS